MPKDERDLFLDFQLTLFEQVHPPSFFGLSSGSSKTDGCFPSHFPGGVRCRFVLASGVGFHRGLILAGAGGPRGFEARKGKSQGVLQGLRLFSLEGNRTGGK